VRVEVEIKEERVANVRVHHCACNSKGEGKGTPEGYGSVPPPVTLSSTRGGVPILPHCHSLWVHYQGP